MSPLGRIFNVITPPHHSYGNHSQPSSQFRPLLSSSLVDDSSLVSGGSIEPPLSINDSKVTSEQEIQTKVHLLEPLLIPLEESKPPLKEAKLEYPHPRPPPPKDASLAQMLEAVWPDSGFFFNPESFRLVCSLNSNFSTSKCSFCKNHSDEFKEQIVRTANWLSGYHNKTPETVNYLQSVNYSRYLSSLELLKKLAEPFIPPTSQEEISKFRENHENVTTENKKIPDLDDEIIGPEIIRKSERFYFNYEGVHLTYSYHFKPEFYIPYIRNKLKDPITLTFYSIVNETGTTGHKHTHVALLFSKKLKHESQKYFDYQESEVNPTNLVSKHPNIQPITGKPTKSGRFQSHFEYFANIAVYHQKQGTPETNITEEDLKGMLVNEIKPSTSRFGRLDMKDIETCSKKELIAICKEKKVDPRDLPKLITAHAIVKEHTDTVEIRKVSSLNVIQEFLVEYSSFSNDRTIIWVADQQGKSGKSYLSTYMSKHHNTLTLNTTSTQGATRALKNHIDRYGSPKTIIFDLARSTILGDDADSVSIYRTIETLKSQYITSTKYDSSVIELSSSPSIIVLSNAFPIVKMLTVDRWVILVTGILPDTFDYCFCGITGQLSMEVFSEYVEKLRKLSEEEGEPAPSLTIPIKMITKVSNYPGSDKLSTDYRFSCWDRGFFPVFHCKALPPTLQNLHGSFDVEVTEEPLSSSEIEAYEEWKKRGTKTPYDTAAYVDMRRDLCEQIEVKLAEKRRLILEKKV